jgi:hypothetical protein
VESDRASNRVHADQLKVRWRRAFILFAGNT